MVHRDDPIVDRKLAYHYQVTMHIHAHAWLIVRYWRQQKTILVVGLVCMLDNRTVAILFNQKTACRTMFGRATSRATVVFSPFIAFKLL